MAIMAGGKDKLRVGLSVLLVPSLLFGVSLLKDNL
jgi:hypothetical protein